LFLGCHEHNGWGYQRMNWPDGGAFLEQENLLVEAFRVIRGEIVAIQKSEAK